MSTHKFRKVEKKGCKNSTHSGIMKKSEIPFVLSGNAERPYGALF